MQTIKSDLGDFGLDVSRLALFFTGGNDMVVAQVSEILDEGQARRSIGDEFLAGRQLIVDKPTRFMMMRSFDRATGALGAQLFTGELEFVADGRLQMCPPMAQWVSTLKESAQKEILEQLLALFEQKRFHRARSAGLHLPGQPR